VDRLVYTTLGAATKQDFLRIQLTNDLANVATTAYKRGSTTSPESVYLRGPGFPVRFQPIVPAGVELIDMRQGSMISTGNLLDIYMQDATVLGVQAADGTIAFTRRGDLHVNANGILETGEGFVVRGEAGPITVPPGFDVTMTSGGGVYVVDPNVEAPEPVQVGQLLLRDASTVPLVRRQDGLYEPRDIRQDDGDFVSGPGTVSIEAGALEGSNVNPMEVMVDLLDMYRAFETQMKIIKNVEELDRDGSSLMRIR